MSFIERFANIFHQMCINLSFKYPAICLSTLLFSL